jgi:hypothetical protein
LWAPFEFILQYQQEQEVQPAVESVQVIVVSAATSMPIDSISLPMLSAILYTTCCIYIGSSYTVACCTAKIVEVQILGGCQKRRIKQTSLLWDKEGIWIWMDFCLGGDKNLKNCI